MSSATTMKIQPPLQLEKKNIAMSRSAMDGAVRDASKIFFEMLDMPYEDEVVNEFLATSDGKRMLASSARLLAFINERNISRLERQVPHS